eukprot:TRINITY_DN20202_c0_g1_i2.p1 TRINITY_DN20202_c0_g1~~TRINITY_DN20202_c0_g1_i2.p1  ORF type:complete len:730 (-),score=141.24 TRINITY_DN20202_c0_g1_i2:128-2317(-)
MPWRLVPIHLPEDPVVVLPQEGSTAFGRRPNNAVVCRDLLVSGHHCVVHCRGGGADEPPEVEDISTNGTWVNDVKLAKSQRQLLTNGDVISLTKQPEEDVDGPSPPRVQFRLELVQPSSGVLTPKAEAIDCHPAFAVAAPTAGVNGSIPQSGAVHGRGHNGSVAGSPVVPTSIGIAAAGCAVGTTTAPTHAPAASSTSATDAVVLKSCADARRMPVEDPEGVPSDFDLGALRCSAAAAVAARAAAVVSDDSPCIPSSGSFAKDLLVQEQKSKAKITGELLLTLRKLETERKVAEDVGRELRKARVQIDEERNRRREAEEGRERATKDSEALRAEQRRLQEQLRREAERVAEASQRLEEAQTSALQAQELLDLRHGEEREKLQQQLSQEQATRASLEAQVKAQHDVCVRFAGQLRGAVGHLSSQLLGIADSCQKEIVASGAHGSQGGGGGGACVGQNGNDVGGRHGAAASRNSGPSAISNGDAAGDAAAPATSGNADAGEAAAPATSGNANAVHVTSHGAADVATSVAPVDASGAVVAGTAVNEARSESHPHRYQHDDLVTRQEHLGEQSMGVWGLEGSHVHALALPGGSGTVAKSACATTSPQAPTTAVAAVASTAAPLETAVAAAFPPPPVTAEPPPTAFSPPLLHPPVSSLEGEGIALPSEAVPSLPPARPSPSVGPEPQTAVDGSAVEMPPPPPDHGGCSTNWSLVLLDSEVPPSAKRPRHERSDP